MHTCFHALSTVLLRHKIFVRAHRNMLGYAKMLWQGSKPESATGMKCDLFVLEGGQWQSLTDGKCTVTFDSKGKAGPTMKFACEEESFAENMRLECVTNLSRFDDVDTGSPCFQWIVRKGQNADNMEEFGARFSDHKQADAFVRAVTAMGQQSADVIYESSSQSPISLVEKLDDSNWDTIDENVSILISQSKNGDNYLTVQKQNSTQDPSDLLFHSLISPALQLEVAEPTLVTFLGFTPLSEDIRVLGIRFDKKEISSFISTLEQIHAIIRKRPRAPRVSIPAWDDDGDDIQAERKPTGTVARRRRRVSEEVMNLHLQTSRTETGQNAIVFSSHRTGDKLGYEVYDTSGNTRVNPKPVSSFTQILPPSKKLGSVMIHEGDRKILMLGADNSVVSELDLERATIVNEWNTDSSRKINSILPVSKSAQSSNEKTFLGMNEKSIFVMDPRIGKTSIAGPAYTYSTNVKLSAAATDDSGHIVIANKLGQFRLFDGQKNRDDQLKRAKSLLSGVGDPVSHVDVTSDGRWVLGTAPTYIVLIDVFDEESGNTGFEKSVSKSAEPVILSIDPSDIAKYKLNSISFTAARFDDSEKKIVSSTGSLAIMWDFESIKKTGNIEYSVKPMKDYIIETNVGSKSVVAMYSDKIEIARVRK